jgi:phosphatidylserine/phosphatidylglycerophosphate/cardiolipin synthase-like enzyme
MKLRTLLAGVALSVLLVTGWAADPQIYFSRKDPVAKVLVREINAAQKSIHVLMYSITDKELGDALVAAAERGVDVRIVLDRTQSSERNSIATSLAERLGPERVVFRTGRGRGVMHQKLAVYDGMTVTLGSYNWTNNAKANNWENLIVLRDAHVANESLQEFRRIWLSPEPKSAASKEAPASATPTEKSQKKEKTRTR